MAVSPARPKGPPLTALRAFEAAARLGSFAEAADELCVSAGAISQHIKALEGWAGSSLFVRTANGVQLTQQGKTILPDLTKAFDSIGLASRTLMELRPKREVHVATLPALAQLWLPQRLARIRTEHSDMDLAVTALETEPNLGREMFDLSLFIREPTGADHEYVFEEDVIFPVCSPSLVAKLTSPADLKSIPLLMDQSWEWDWELWCREMGLSPQMQAGISRYSLYSLALEEAKAGAGFLMGHACLVEDALSKGDLVRPFTHKCATGKALMLTLPTGKKQDEELARLVAMFG